MTLPRILSPAAPPAPTLKPEQPTIRQIAAKFGWNYARKVEALRYRVRPDDNAPAPQSCRDVAG